MGNVFRTGRVSVTTASGTREADVVSSDGSKSATVQFDGESGTREITIIPGGGKIVGEMRQALYGDGKD